MQLRAYQQDAIDSFNNDPRQRKMIVLPTGCGKTLTSLSLAKSRGAKTLWLAHREELITQPIKTLKLLWPERSYGIVKAERNEFMRDFVFASIQSAQQERRIEQLSRQNFDLVVVDEAHHALSDGYQNVLRALRCFEPNGTQLLGVTATPERSDSLALDTVFEKIVYQIDINTAIAGGYLVPPRVVEWPIKVDLDEVSNVRGDFGMKQLDLSLMKAGIVGEIVSSYVAHCTDKKTLIFVVSVEQAEQCAAALRERGYKAKSVSGETPSEERKRILRQLETGEIQCVVNCMVLTEGFDEPSISAVILARPTQSKPLMIQCVGRGLRLFPNKSDCLIIDMVGSTKRNSLMQAAVLFGLRPDPNKETRSALLATPGEENSEEFWRARFMSQIKGLGGAPRSKLRWMPSHDGRGWLLHAGEHGTIALMPHEDDWTITLLGIERQPLSNIPVPMETAQAIAEDFVRRVKAVELARAAQWRNAGITEAQAAILQKNKINIDGMSKGTASDLITQMTAHKKLEPATPKQIAALRRHGVKVPDGLTKREAFKLFAELNK